MYGDNHEQECRKCGMNWYPGHECLKARVPKVEQQIEDVQMLDENRKEQKVEAQV